MLGLLRRPIAQPYYNCCLKTLEKLQSSIIRAEIGNNRRRSCELRDARPRFIKASLSFEAYLRNGQRRVGSRA